MNIRFNGPTDLLERTRALLGVDATIYPNRGQGDQARLYVTLDDRVFEAMLDAAEQTGTALPIVSVVRGEDVR